MNETKKSWEEIGKVKEIADETNSWEQVEEIKEIPENKGWEETEKKGKQK